MFNEPQIKLLNDPLDPEHVKKRNGAGNGALSYMRVG